MIAGLFVGAVLAAGAEPDAPKPAPLALESHRDALARYGAAVWNRRRDRLLTAAKMLEAAVKDDPDASEPARELARLYAQLGRDLDAIRLAQKAVQKDPSDLDSALLLARLNAAVGEWPEAVAAARLALAGKPLADAPERAVPALRELASVCERGNDLASAEAALVRAAEALTDGRAKVMKAAALTPKEVDADAADALERLGRVRVKRGKFDPAAEAFESAAGLYAKVGDTAGTARLAWNLSGALEAKGEPEAALKHLETFLALRPRTAVPYQRFVRLLRAANRDNEVTAELQKYRARDKANDALAAVLAAELARAPGTRAEGDRLFAALTAETADPDVVAVVVRSHLDTRRPVEIIKDLDRSFELLKDEGKKPKEPETPDAVKKKAFAGEKARAYADALGAEPDGPAALLRAAGDDLTAGAKRASGTYFFLGALASKHRKLELAILQFRQAVRFAPPAVQWDAYSALFQVLRLANRTAEIEAECRNGLAAGALGGNELLFNYHLSLALAEQGKADALKVADKLVGQGGDLNRLTVCVRRHAVLCATGQYADAVEYGQKLLDEFEAPADRTRIRHEQAAAHSAAKKYADAEATLRAILDDEPDDARALNALGYLLADQGRELDEAERLIRRAAVADRIDRRKSGAAEPESAIIRDSLGWVLFRRGKLAEARAELERAAGTAAGAAEPLVWDHLGDVLFRLNEGAKAKAAWEKARELYEADGRTALPARRARLDEVKSKLKRVP